MTKLGLVLLLATASAQVSASAQAEAGGDSTAALQRICSSDYTRFCKGLDPEGSEVVTCFLKNRSELTPDCQAAIAEHAKAESGHSARPQ